MNAKNVVKITASISEIGKNIYKIINDDSIPTIIDRPPGLGTIVFSFLFTSTTVMLRFSKARITKGVNPYTEKNAIVIAIIAGIISCSNYNFSSTYFIIVSASLEPILSIAVNFFKVAFFRAFLFLNPA